MEDAPEAKSKAETTPRDDQGRFQVEEEPKAADPAPVEEAKKPEAKQEAKPAPAPAPKKATKENKVEVTVAALVYSPRKKNSVSVAVLQDRLAALGYAAARSDFRGWFHDGTKSAIEKWQKENGLAVTGDLSKPEDLKFLFDGAEVVLV